jgi:SAM-dependent methyltransferase
MKTLGQQGRFSVMICAAFLGLLRPSVSPGAAPDDAVGTLAAQILQTAGVQGGLVVHVGCGDGRLTAALGANERYLVHGLDTDAANVEKARRHVRSEELDAGEVSIDRYDGKHLPLIDNIVNLLIVTGPPSIGETELLRVLCPDGVMLKLAADGGSRVEERMVKPRPRAIDEWTHFLHGPDGNAVAQDEVVGFPHHIQWVGSPRHSRDHEFTTSMDVMVSAGGRIFYILDEGPTAIPYHLPSRWVLAARDAFNGLVLWKRPLAEWRPYLVRGRKSLAADMWRRLVATGNAVYLTETIFGAVVMIDPATGETVSLQQSKTPRASAAPTSGRTGYRRIRSPCS